jgi:methyl-accepting chemotaxis protein
MNQSVRSQNQDGAGAERQNRRQRKLRNYLLDKGFQLKYTGIVIGVTAVLAGVLGYFVYHEIVVSQKTILARNLASSTYVIEPGDVDARLRVSNRLDEDFNEAIRTKIAVVVSINNAPSQTVAQGTADYYQRLFDEELTRTTATLISALLVFLMVLTVVWVFLTHKIAGPMYKMKLIFSKVSGDNLKVEGRIRHSDELQHVFLGFQEMIDRLRGDREAQVEGLTEIEALLERDEAGEAREKLVQMRERLRSSLDEAE